MTHIQNDMADLYHPSLSFEVLVEVEYNLSLSPNKSNNNNK